MFNSERDRRDLVSELDFKLLELLASFYTPSSFIKLFSFSKLHVYIWVCEEKFIMHAVIALG